MKRTVSRHSLWAGKLEVSEVEQERFLGHLDKT